MRLLVGEIALALLYAVLFGSVIFLFFYAFIFSKIKPLLKKIKIDASIIDVKREYLRFRRDFYLTSGYYDIVNCRYEFEGKIYESKEIIPARIRSREVGDVIKIYMDPQNPSDTYVFLKRNIPIMICVGGMLACCALFTTIYIVQIFNPDFNLLNANQAIEKTVDSEVDSKQDRVEDSEEKDDVTVVENEWTKKAKEYKDIKNKKIDKINNIKDAKTGEFDGYKEYVSSAKEIKLGTSSVYLPKTYRLNMQKDNTNYYIDSRTSDEITFNVDNNKKSDGKEVDVLRSMIRKKYKVTAADKYTFNKTNYEIYTDVLTKDKCTLYVIGYNDKKRIYITFVSSIDTKLDVRDVLSSIIL